MNVVLYIFFVLKVEAILNRCHLKQAFFRYKIAVQTNEGGIERPHCGASLYIKKFSFFVDLLSNAQRN